MIIHVIAGFIKKTLYKQVYILLNRMKMLVDMQKLNQIYLIMRQKKVQNEQQKYTFNLTSKSDLASLKAEVDKIDKAKLKTVSGNRRKLCKKTLYDKLVTKVNTSATSGLVIKLYTILTKKVEKNKLMTVTRKILDDSVILKNADYNTKIIDIEYIIPSITDLATTTPHNTSKIRYPKLVIQSKNRF